MLVDKDTDELTEERTLSTEKSISNKSLKRQNTFRELYKQQVIKMPEFFIFTKIIVTFFEAVMNKKNPPCF